MITCELINEELIFSDDRRELDPKILESVLKWLNTPSDKRDLFQYFRVYNPPQANYSAFDFASFEPTVTLSEIAFRLLCFNVVDKESKTHRLFLYAEQTDKSIQILGPEIDKHERVIGPSPIQDVVIRKEDQPPEIEFEIREALNRRWMDIALQVWNEMTPEERLKHPSIGEKLRCYLD